MPFADRLDKTLIRARFAAKAAGRPHDALLETEIGTRLMEHLDPVKLEPHRILDVGCGHGRSLVPLASRYPQADLFALDFAHPMLLESRATTLAAGIQTHMVCTDAEQVGLADHQFDLVYSNLTLGWLSSIPAALTEFHRLLVPGGLLTLAILGPDTLKELRESFAAVDSTIHVHHFTDMHDMGDALVEAGFRDIVVDAERLTIEYREFDRLLDDLREWGIGNTAQERRRGLTGRTRFNAVEQAYERHRRADGILPASVEVAYVHAWAPRSQEQAVPRVDFGPLRRRR